MAKVPFVHSNFERKDNDDYRTVDPRCVYGLLEHVRPTGLVVDPCSPEGSGIVDVLVECGYNAKCGDDAFADAIHADWIITNPPYTRPLVDDIINRQIERVRGREIFGFACLLRAYFDHAKSRDGMFKKNTFYLGQIKLCFRPWWSESRGKQPIHHFVWHIWTGEAFFNSYPIILYSNGDKREILVPS